ncbi:MAG TPA: Ig-like domain-containing protein [Micromonosporaceae bacterium]|nr:Ig-like domain-containing protein [Micromonosporaceae bacterium]
MRGGQVLLVGVLTVPLLLGGCAGEQPAARWRHPGAGPVSPPTLTVTPATGAKDLPISTEIGVRAVGAAGMAVSLTDERGARVTGVLRPDGTAWVPDRPLRYRAAYTALVTATGSGGATETKSTTFTTMAQPRDGRVGTGLYLFDNITYGVAMPVVVELGTEIAPQHRAGVERRMFVTTQPPQPGAWHWFGGRQVMYRAPAFWRPGTRLTVRIALEGHPMGGGRFGDVDRRASVVIGDKLVVKVDNATKQMTVHRNDELLRTLPVSLGKPSTPSSSGTMVIMDKLPKTVFDTMQDPDPRNRYRIDIEYAQRLTWGGEFIHAAPWSAADQGRRNVSHGCVNVSMSDAQWLFRLTKIGDPVTVRGTERRLEPGNGWTAWDLSWDEFLKGSALPHPELARHPATATPSPSG